EDGMRNSIDGVSISNYTRDDASSSSSRPNAGLGARILMSLARAKAVIIKESPPHYTRGAWAIINDVPYPPPPPYAGSSRHPPSYEDAMEIGVVASPLRVEQLLRSCPREPLIPRVASAPQLASWPSGSSTPSANSGHAITRHTDDESELLLPIISDTVDSLPKYGDIDATLVLSPVVRRWNLGQQAFEKPPRHPKGYQYPPARGNSNN
ncbi:hypothetical protein LPJ59_006335, partial [Coemansia sp. RSA 2399]